MATQLECLEVLEGSDAQVCQTLMKDLHFAQHRFHSIVEPWGNLLLMMLAFFRHLSTDSCSPVQTPKARKSAADTMRVLADFETLAFLGMAISYLSCILPILDLLQKDFQDPAYVAERLLKIKAIGIDLIMESNILTASSGRTFLRLVLLQVRSGHIFCFGEGESVAMDYRPGAFNPAFIVDALARMQQVVSLVNELIDQSLDANKTAAQSTLDQSYVGFSLNKWEAWRANKEFILDRFRRLCAARSWDFDAEEQMRMVGELAVRLWKQGSTEDRDNIRFPQACWRNAFFQLAAKFDMPVVRKMLCDYFGFRKSTCAGERDIRHLDATAKESAGNAKLQVYKDRLTIKRYGPTKVEEIATRQVLDHVVVLHATVRVQRWNGLWSYYKGTRHMVAQKKTKRRWPNPLLEVDKSYQDFSSQGTEQCNTSIGGPIV